MKSINEWFQKKKEQKEVEAKTEKLDLPGNLWIKCYKCKSTIYSHDLEANLKVCPKCGFLIEQRTNPQSAAWYALLSQISKVRDWPAGSGQYHGVKVWQMLLISAWEQGKLRPLTRLDSTSCAIA